MADAPGGLTGFDDVLAAEDAAVRLVEQDPAHHALDVELFFLSRGCNVSEVSSHLSMARDGATRLFGEFALFALACLAFSVNVAVVVVAVVVVLVVRVCALLSLALCVRLALRVLSLVLRGRDAFPSRRLFALVGSGSSSCAVVAVIVGLFAALVVVVVVDCAAFLRGRVGFESVATQTRV